MQVLHRPPCLSLATLSLLRESTAVFCFTVFWCCRKEEAIKKALVAWLHRTGGQTGRNINRHTQSTGRQTGTQSGNSGGQTDGLASCTRQRWQRWQVYVFAYVWVMCGQPLNIWWEAYAPNTITHTVYILLAVLTHTVSIHSSFILNKLGYKCERFVYVEIRKSCFIRLLIECERNDLKLCIRSQISHNLGHKNSSLVKLNKN